MPDAAGEILHYKALWTSQRSLSLIRIYSIPCSSLPNIHGKGLLPFIRIPKLWRLKGSYNTVIINYIIHDTKQFFNL